MSSKRKNTPTKLPKEDLENEDLPSDSGLGHVSPDHDALHLDGWSSSGCHSDAINANSEEYFPPSTETNVSQHGRETDVQNGTSERNNGEGREVSNSTDDSAYSDRATNGEIEKFGNSGDKLLGEGSSPSRVTGDTAEEERQSVADPQLAGSAAGSPLAIPVLKKSMESVIRRLNSKASDSSGTTTSLSSEASSSEPATLTPAASEEKPQVMDTVQAVLAGEATLSEKERQISEMINHLQNIKENLSKQKAVPFGIDSNLSGPIIVYIDRVDRAGIDIDNRPIYSVGRILITSHETLGVGTDSSRGAMIQRHCQAMSSIYGDHLSRDIAHVGLACLEETNGYTATAGTESRPELLCAFLGRREGGGRVKLRKSAICQCFTITV
ncbi:hypothetical protein RRG08_024859 [Elysia crispata]|uniref:Uncharacterized protein n=1 Tax=Elysia crispata TaxID=231223 RepID=A0AAE1CZK4_9GAST|nr:hypothetical protein RRG08_024859 [Elysia crispata]